MTPAEQAELLNRASPAYRAAVTGNRELPAVQARGAVRFMAYGVSEYFDGGRHIIRASIDEGQSVEIVLPAGLGVYFTSLTPKTAAVKKREGRAVVKSTKGGTSKG